MRRFGSKRARTAPFQLTTLMLLWTAATASGQGAPPPVAAPAVGTTTTTTTPAPAATGAAPTATSATSDDLKKLPAGHEPAVRVALDPPTGVRTGELVHLRISADAQLGDDVTVAEQSFAPFEVHKKSARVEPPNGQSQRFVFEIELLAFEPSDKPVPAVELRVVTKENFVGSVKTQPLPYRVRSWLANEPNAQPKLETKPVLVMQDNYLPIYAASALLAIAIIAGLTLLVQRYLRNRKKAAPPPVPRRPPWDVAVEKLGELRRRKQRMLEEGKGGQFVDQVSDVVREYLGARYAFEGLETTSDEMLALLKARGVSVGFTQEVGMFLGRCDLVKFAKVEPDQDEADLILAKAQEVVHTNQPQPQSQPQPPPVTASGVPSSRPEALPPTAAGSASAAPATPHSPEQPPAEKGGDEP